MSDNKYVTIYIWMVPNDVTVDRRCLLSFDDVNWDVSFPFQSISIKYWTTKSSGQLKRSKRLAARTWRPPASTRSSPRSTRTLTSVTSWTSPSRWRPNWTKSTNILSTHFNLELVRHFLLCDFCIQVTHVIHGFPLFSGPQIDKRNHHLKYENWDGNKVKWRLWITILPHPFFYLF